MLDPPHSESSAGYFVRFRSMVDPEFEGRNYFFPKEAYPLQLGSKSNMWQHAQLCHS